MAAGVSVRVTLGASGITVSQLKIPQLSDALRQVVQSAAGSGAYTDKLVLLLIQCSNSGLHCTRSSFKAERAPSRNGAGPDGSLGGLSLWSAAGECRYT